MGSFTFWLEVSPLEFTVIIFLFLWKFPYFVSCLKVFSFSLCSGLFNSTLSLCLLASITVVGKMAQLFYCVNKLHLGWGTLDFWTPSLMCLRVDFLLFILHEIYWTSWICCLVSFIIGSGIFFVIISSNIFSVSLLLLCYWTWYFGSIGMYLGSTSLSSISFNVFHTYMVKQYLSFWVVFL